VKDINPTSQSIFGGGVNVGGTIFFFANDGTSGIELWKSDGTAAGTMMVKDIVPGVGSSHNPFLGSGAMARVGSLLYFSVIDSTHGVELWKTDGTEEGTVLAADVAPGPTGSAPARLTDYGGTLLFTANDGVNGDELWALVPDTTTSTTTTTSSTTSTTLPGVPVVGKKLIIVDKTSLAGKAKVVYVSTDQAAGITKGSGVDTSNISATFDYAYDGVAGQLRMQAGALGASEGWKVNKATVAKFVNKDTVGGSTVVKVGVIKPGKLLKVVGKGLGDAPDVIDIVTAGPSGEVFTAFTVDNGGEVNTHCSAFPECSYKLIAADTGAKLVCKNGVPDPDCKAVGCP
jgi:ELWxxDGT repeat protein